MIILFSKIINKKRSLRKPIIIGFQAPSAAGKTLFAKDIQKKFGEENVLILTLDNFYHGLRSGEKASERDWDIPSSFNFKLLIKSLKLLSSGQSVEIPIYDFTIHKPKEKGLIVHSRPIIIVEGILVFSNEELNKLFDYTISIDADRKLRFHRRRERDQNERGRTLGEINIQLKQVAAAEDKFIFPSIEKMKEIMGENHYTINNNTDGGLDRKINNVVNWIKEKIQPMN